MASAGGVDGVSVSLWLKPGTLAGDMRLWGPLRRSSTPPSPQGTVGLWLDGSGNGTLRAYHWTQNMWTNLTVTGTVKTNQWQHLGFTWRGKHMIAYLNGNVMGGIDDSKFEFDRDVSGEAVSFGIGAKYLSYGVTYDGKMDDLSIWGSTLSPEQVRTLASGQSPLSVPPSAGAKAPPKPLAEYRLDGNALDVRGKYNGSAVNGASFTNGTGNTPFEYGGNMSLRLDGVNDEVTLANAAALRPGTNAWTLSVWFKAAATNQLGTVMAIRKATSPSTQMSVYVGGPDVGGVGSGMRVHSFVIGTQSPQVGRWETYTTGAYLDDRWHHVALVRTCNTLTPIVYVDGEVAPFIGLSSTATLLDVDSTDPWRIGSNGVGYYFAGLIDEAAMWNTALSSEQVAWLAKNSLSAIPPRGTLIRMQ